MTRDGDDASTVLMFELPDGFAVRVRAAAEPWNGFPVPLVGLTDALRICLHVSDDPGGYLCGRGPDGRFAADGLQWQQVG